MHSLIQFQLLLLWFTASLDTKSQFYHPTIDSRQIAFPGAEGFGKYASGGRGGMVYIVTNLDDSGPGSLRWAVEAKGPRTVVFEVSGNIELKSRLNVGDGNLTIAGQSAPGDGITIQNYPFRIIGKSNIIIRFLRFRLGDLGDEIGDAFEARSGCDNLIIDHCSFSWGLDETCSIYDVSKTTIQNCIISEGLNKKAGDGKENAGENHAFGGLIGGQDVSFFRNLMAHFLLRMPSITTRSNILDIRNSVFYNWEFRATNNGAEAKANLVGNYYKPGPATLARPQKELISQHFLWPTALQKNPSTYGQFFLEGNQLEGRNEVYGDQWKGVRLENSENNRNYISLLPNTDKDGTKVPFFVPEGLYSETISAEKAYVGVLKYAGSSLSRDTVDSRIVNEVKFGTVTFSGSISRLLGIVDSQSDVGGWPTLKSLPAPIDADRDGIPDAWEKENGLNPERRDNRFYDLDPNYTNLEVYLNSLVAHIMVK